MGLFSSINPVSQIEDAFDGLTNIVSDGLGGSGEAFNPLELLNDLPDVLKDLGGSLVTSGLENATDSLDTGNIWDAFGENGDLLGGIFGSQTGEGGILGGLTGEGGILGGLTGEGGILGGLTGEGGLPIDPGLVLGMGVDLFSKEGDGVDLFSAIKESADGFGDFFQGAASLDFDKMLRGGLEINQLATPLGNLDQLGLGEYFPALASTGVTAMTGNPMAGKLAGTIAVPVQQINSQLTDPDKLFAS